MSPHNYKIANKNLFNIQFYNKFLYLKMVCLYKRKKLTFIQTFMVKSLNLCLFCVIGKIF